MSKFRVGQRVRIKWSRNFPELIGTEGVVSLPPRTFYLPPAGHVTVAPDSWGDPSCPYIEGAYFCPFEGSLEPATDSYDVVSWDACVWKPEHLRVGA